MRIFAVHLVSALGRVVTVGIMVAEPGQGFREVELTSKNTPWRLLSRLLRGTIPEKISEEKVAHLGFLGALILGLQMDESRPVWGSFMQPTR